MTFSFIKQPDAMDCGPACLCMVAKHYEDYTLESLRNKSFIGWDDVPYSRTGCSMYLER
ncbi:MAG: cysteine peptidase family C39 domain-containing protein [Bacteroidales bacterium]